jgi:probable HAF family extracellular repeat protein
MMRRNWRRLGKERPARVYCFSHLFLEPLEERNLLTTWSITDLGVLSTCTAIPHTHCTSEARGINSHGDIVGSSSSNRDGTQQHAFLYSGGTMTDLETIGGTPGDSHGLGINDDKAVVGYSVYDSTDLTKVHAFRKTTSDTNPFDVGALISGSGNSYGTAINNVNNVVGRYNYDSSSATKNRAFWYHGSTVDTL